MLHLTKSRISSERRACRLAGVSRFVAQYRLLGRDDSALRERLRSLAAAYPRDGYPTLYDMLKSQGWVINRKRTYRLSREEGLQVRAKRRKTLGRLRVPMLVPSAVNDRWCVDFSISGQRLANELDRLAQSRTLPKTLVCDNGPELTGKAMFSWSQRTRVKLHFIQPGKPTQNAFIESFNGKLRAYCLDLRTGSSISTRHGQPSNVGAYTTTRSGHTAPWIENPPHCSLAQSPDMLNLPHRTWTYLRGTVNTYAGLCTRFENACQGLSITPEQLRWELEENGDIANLVSGALRPAALRLIAETLDTMRYAGGWNPHQRRPGAEPCYPCYRKLGDHSCHHQ